MKLINKLRFAQLISAPMRMSLSLFRQKFNNLLILMVFYPISMLAHDLGQHGQVWIIGEENMKDVIAGKIVEQDWDEILGDVVTKTENYTKNLEPHNLPHATETKTKYVDPSFALDRDIVHNGQVLYKKGTWVNPLDHMRPNTGMLFFDGEFQDQLDFAIQAAREHPDTLKLVMTQGDPGELSKRLGIPVFYADKGLIHHYHITHVPTLLSVGAGEYEKFIAVTQFTQPFQVRHIDQCWNGCKVYEQNEK